MNKTKLTAAALAAAMLWGCTPKEQTEVSESSSRIPQTESTVCRLESFSFDCDGSGFEVKNTSGIDDSVSMYFLELPGSGAAVSVYELQNFITPELYMEELSEYYTDDEYYTALSWELDSSGDMIVSCFRAQDAPNTGGNMEYRKYFAFDQCSVLVIDESYNFEYSEMMVEASEKLMESVKYISDNKLPTERYSIETESFRLTAEPVWYLDYCDDEEPDCSYVGLRYAVADSRDKENVYIDIEAELPEQPVDLEEYLDDLIGSNESLTISSGSCNFCGYEARYSGYEYGDDVSRSCRVIAFQPNELLFTVVINSSADNKETAADIDKLFETFEVK